MQCSFARDRPLSDLESHGSVSSVVQCSFAQDGPLSDPDSHGSVSPVAECSFARDGPLSDPESHGSVSSVVQGSFARDNSFSSLESLTLIALSCNPKFSPAGQQTTKHDGLYPLLSVSLTVLPFVERFQQRDDPGRVGFYALAFLSFFGFYKSVVHTTSFWLSNVASLASYIFRHV